MFKVLSQKLLLVFTVLTLSLPAMEMKSPGINTGKRAAESLEINQELKNGHVKKNRGYTEAELDISITDEISAAIYNFNSEVVDALLACKEGKSLTADQKIKLYELASMQSLQTKQLERLASQIVLNASDATIKEQFSFQKQLTAIKKIKTTLGLFRYLKNFKFPQAVFSPKPYCNGPCISLDMILESLIMAEQQQISSCCFHLTLFNIAQALTDKKKEGIDIEIVTNQKQADKNPTLHGLIRMANNGIPLFCPKNNQWETNHHKFFVFGRNVLNKQLVLMGSYNPTGHSNKHSWDDAMILDDAEVVQDYRHRFAELKNASQPLPLEELKAVQTNPSDIVLKLNNIPEELWK